MVAYIIAWASFVGPTQAAVTRGLPSTTPPLIASPATTGSSTINPRLMVNDAIDHFCKSMPLSLRIARGEISLVTGPALVITADIDDIAGVNRCTGVGGADDHTPEFVDMVEFTGRTNRQVLPLHFKDPAGGRYISRRKPLAQIDRLHSVRCQSLLRVFKIDLFRKHA